MIDCTSIFWTLKDIKNSLKKEWSEKKDNYYCYVPNRIKMEYGQKY